MNVIDYIFMVGDFTVAIALAIEKTDMLYMNVYVYFERFAAFVVFVNYAFNPLIYFVTVKSFNIYVKQLIKKITKHNVVEPTMPRQNIADKQL